MIMKILKNLKITQLADSELNERELKSLKGGVSCGCGCYYQFDGGASIKENYNANLAKGYTDSYGGNVACGSGVPATGNTH